MNSNEHHIWHPSDGQITCDEIKASMIKSTFKSVFACLGGSRLQNIAFFMLL